MELTRASIAEGGGLTEGAGEGARPQSAMQIRVGLKEGMEGGDQTIAAAAQVRVTGVLVCVCMCVCVRACVCVCACVICICILHSQPLGSPLLKKMQTGGPFSRYVSASMAKEDIMKYLAESRRKGVSLQGNKAQKLDEQHLRFLKQSGMSCASAQFAQSHVTNDITQTYLHLC